MAEATKGTRLGGGPAHERLLLANAAAALFTHKSIKTTEAKARRLRPLAERLMTFAKRGDLHARRRVLSVIGDKEVVHILFTEIAPLVAGREGGYTRITKVGNRKGDNAPMAVIELVLEPVNPKPKSAKKPNVASPASANTEPPAIRYRRQSRALFQFSAYTREELESVAEPLGLAVFGYGRDDSWVVASRLLRGIDDDPAVLQITRAKAGAPNRYLISAAWVGEQPDLNGIVKGAYRAVGDRGFAVDDVVATRTAIGPRLDKTFGEATDAVAAEIAGQFDDHEEASAGAAAEDAAEHRR